jgi:hypothetical protein
MDPATADEAFGGLVRRQIIQAFALTPEESEEVFSTEPGSYGAARAEYEAEFEAFKASAQERAEEFAAGYTAQMVACGRLPEGVTMRWEPADG